MKSLFVAIGLISFAAVAQKRQVTVKVFEDGFSEGWNIAAHSQLPLGTIVRASYPPTKRTVVLKIGHPLPRNPSVEMAISRAAADSLGITEAEAQIAIEYSPISLMRAHQIVPNAYRDVIASRQPPKKQPLYYENEEVPSPPATASENAPSPTAEYTPVAKPAKSKPANTKKEATIRKTPFAPKGIYNRKGTSVVLKGFVLQFHALQQLEKALKAAENLEKKKIGRVYIQVEEKQPVYRVIVGTYSTRSAAEKAAKSIKLQHQLSALVRQL
ncbi:MAG: SPOR domain-containing protein [Cytophagales bacterium]|nr:SPOR domain-containing protein [Bernardetiaceae bacterium]MDW8211585.1 SPOR domain-containing protein [Cytophagales bacterium]